MTYQVQLRPAAVRSLKRIDHQDGDRIRGVIVLLGEAPRPPGAKALQGRPDLRVRIGDYRIVYTVDENILVVAVITLGHRSSDHER
ncbi:MULTISPECIES: type II toxin-antitoxin system RelE family toxin [Arthrobacter]|uniref:type II toxin-antitoxin system RelE family toxin n=1 Tax=Arthrobacter TaxID=1663 RepID=UPI0009EC9894|nr:MULTISPECIES: type II toxin-antitoxin system RelE/ParE family toxin [Arthrobacter]